LEFISQIFYDLFLIPRRGILWVAQSGRWSLAFLRNVSKFLVFIYPQNVPTEHRKRFNLNNFKLAATNTGFPEVTNLYFKKIPD
jgi:hypothetical protein